MLVFLCLSGVVEGDLSAVEAYKTSGGDIARQLSADEVRLLNRPSAFDVGYTLVHLSIRFQRQDMLAILLTEVSSFYGLNWCPDPSCITPMYIMSCLEYNTELEPLDPVKYVLVHVSSALLMYKGKAVKHNGGTASTL